ncbi:Protein of unknown function [Shimia gijangensis]|uniref:DUF3445 domain-containing protein n=1 Tax=Shimia gijangensis TaxID=1470563 RepID=A0A1M6EBT1_9RHOB|nr:DUF3445 domain-containing protein [Shimia gijangensis]SHI82934.1 Protein of unknown function [Shimia gijangensis]
MNDVLQKSMPFDPSEDKPLPGIAPLAFEDWLIVDDAYACQMALRAELISESRSIVLQIDPKAQAAALELLEKCLNLLLARPERDFECKDGIITCPDGRRVPLNQADPLGTLGLLTQEDFCILQKDGDEHVLTGAVLCFPASWALSEKFLRPLVGIHQPVDSYTDNIAKRVQRLFDGVRANRPLWRSNALWYADAILHQPRRASERRPFADPQTAPYFRSEKQSILRLPQSDAVVFSIHTFVLARENVALRS